MAEEKFKKEKIGEIRPGEQETGALQEKARETSPQIEEDLKKRERIRQILTQLKQTTPVSKRDETDEIDNLSSSNEKVAALIALTFEKQNIVYATSVARSLKNPAILDQFHDTLIDEYLDDLIGKGIVSN